MTKKYNSLVFLCRAQPLHNAHVEIIRRAQKLADQLIIIVGSANQPSTFKNPWSSSERKGMISSVISDINNSIIVHIEENTDTIYNNPAWVARIQAIVGKYTKIGEKIGIIGHKKDPSTESYLKMFPQWVLEEIELIEPLNATNIRDLYFRKDANLNFLNSVVPSSVLNFLVNWKKTPKYEQVIKEREFVEKYKLQYASLPYAPIFVTTDAVVICSGHVLMIKRRCEPGKNLLALPGGFVNAATDNSIRDAMIRELREETGIKIPIPVLLGSIVANRVFDAPDRSVRGRTITHVYRIDLPDGELPKVRGLDDAEKASWVPIANIKSEETFEDHAEIIQNMLGA
jgi:bifunctional NMN adenylyltransferase/nudix hydrolase